MFLITIITITILILSVMIHEISHGYVADWLGDPTARIAGRLTLNPLKHIDLFGSIILPLMTSLAGFMLGWAKPVPFNPYNLKNPRRDELLIAVAGPLSNIFLALIFGTIIRFIIIGATTITPFIEILSYIVVINIVLAVFNLIPLPPLDGSKILFSLLPAKYFHFREQMESYGMILIFVVVIFLWQIIVPVIPVIFKLITGIA